MTISTILTTNNSSFQNLAFFICHLFIDGRFRTGHILHDPNTFPVAQFIAEIQSICPHSIPWLLTDVMEPSQLPWTSDKRTDQIVQLIFLDPDHLPTSIGDLKKFFTLYRLFVFPSHGGSAMEGPSNENTNLEHNNDVIKLASTFDLSSLTSLRVSKNGSVCFHWAHDSKTTESYNQLIHEQIDLNSMSLYEEKCKFDNENLFETIFGNIARKMKIVIDYFYVIPCDENKHVQALNKRGEGSVSFANFLFSYLNASFMNITKWSCKSKKVIQQVARFKPRKFYKELTTEYELVENEEL